MSGARLITAREYADAFGLWRALARDNTPRPRYGQDHARMRGAIDALVEGGCAAVLAAFPDESLRSPDVYCEVFAAYLGEGHEDRIEAVRELDLAIRKSCLLSRLIYVGEAPRTVPCPEHGGRWSGCHFHQDDLRCSHGCGALCGCNTGWLRAEDAPSDARLPRALPAGLSPAGDDGLRPAEAVAADVAALSGVGFRVWSYPPHDAPDAARVALHVGRAGFDIRRAVELRYRGGHLLVACGDRVPGAPDLTERSIEEGGPA